MGLANVVATTPARAFTGGHPCSVGTLLDRLAGDDRDALLLLLYGESRTPGGWGRPATEVDALLREAGYIVSRQQINRHRSGQCRCSR